MNVEGKTAIITGGASGIGAAIAKELITRGAAVLVADIDGDAAAAHAATLGANASALQFDAASVEAVEAMADRAWQQTGGIDLVFANAGVSAGAPLLQTTSEAFDWQFSVNVRGVWATAKAFISRMIADGRKGAFTVTASEHALGLQHLGAGVYTSTKHAVLGLAEVLRGETPDSVQISVFCPGLVATQLFDAGRFGVLPEAPAALKAMGAAVMNKGMSPEQVARAAVDGTERGDFYIVTHATALAAAETRFEEIRQAFADQAPMNEDAKQYEVNAVIASVMAELGGGTQ